MPSHCESWHPLVSSTEPCDVSHKDSNAQPRSPCCWLAQWAVIIKQQRKREGDKREINVDVAAHLIHCEAWQHEICPARTVLPPSSQRIGTFMKGRNREPSSVAIVWDRESRGSKHSRRLTLLLLFTTAENQPVCPRGKPRDKGFDCYWL